MRVALLLVAAAPAPVVEAEYRYEGVRGEGELNLAADRVLPEICESDLRQIPVAPVELVEGFAGSVMSTFRFACSCRLCLLLLKTAETRRQQQSAERKADYRN